MAIWIKPSGIEIEINDNPATVDYVKSLGWKLKEDKESGDSRASSESKPTANTRTSKRKSTRGK